MFAIIIALAALLIPPIVNQIADVADNAPRYAQDVQDYVHKNKRLRKLEKDYDITDEAGGRGRQAAEQDRRCGRDAAGHRPDAGQQPLRPGHDPRPDGLHARERAAMAGIRC